MAGMTKDVAKLQTDVEGIKGSVDQILALVQKGGVSP
jgi:hypothetical protein